MEKIYPLWNKIKIGFEYEVIIQCLDNNILNDVFKIEDEVQKYSCYNYGINGIHRNSTRTRDTYVLRVIRHKLAEYYHQVQNIKYNKIKYNFKKADGYKKKLCNVPSGIKKENSWQIQHDGSVSLQQDKNLSIKLYETLNIQKFATKDQINILNSSRKVFENLEIVSPVLTIKNNKHKEVIYDVYSNIFGNTDLFYFNNSTTSNHIHFSCGDDFRNKDNLYNICMNWIHFEPLFYSLCPFWRKKNPYCNSLNKTMKKNLESERYNAIFMGEDKDQFSDIYEIINLFQGNHDDDNTRYASLNLLNLVENGTGTIEIRLKHGSNDPEELCCFIELFAKFFDASIRGKRVDSNDTTMLSVLCESQKNTEYLNLAYNYFFDKILNESTSILKHYFYQLNIHLLSVNKIALISRNLEGGGKNKSHYVFSYGSNHIDQINKRTGSYLKKSQLGTLHGFVRIFAGKSPRWENGGIAALYPLENGKTNGSIIKLTDNQLSLLDKYEGGYDRRIEKVTMKTLNNKDKIISCFVYFKKNTVFVNPPSKKYLSAIRTNLNNNVGVKKKQKITIRKLLSDKKTIKIIGYF